MKFIAFIMSLLVLALSFLPCTDKEMDVKNGKANTEIVKSNPQNSTHQHHGDCSPFCQCACCAGFTITHSIPTITITIFYKNISLGYFSQLNIRKVALPIWQPPQLL